MSAPTSAAWIETYRGGKFFPADPRPEHVDIVEIAHALSMICRFTGHTQWHYSVAQHSVHVAKLMGPDPSRMLYGLLHDASEAYLSDVASPVKALPEFEGYRLIERRLQACVYRRYGLDPEAVPADLAKADMVMLVAEADQVLQSRRREEWGVDWALAEHFPDGIRHLTPGEAEVLFLGTFHAIERLRETPETYLRSLS